MQKPFKRTKTRPLGGTRFGAVDVGVCISETKHNRKSRVRTRHRDMGGRWRERAGTRADVNKPRAGASTALTISGIFGSVAVRCGRCGPRSEERRRRQRKQHKHRVTQGGSARTRYIRTRFVPSYTTVSRPAPMQFTSPHPAPDWHSTRRASERRPRAAACTVPRPAPHAATPTRPAPLAHVAPRAGPNAAPPALAARSSYVR